MIVLHRRSYTIVSACEAYQTAETAWTHSVYHMTYANAVAHALHLRYTTPIANDWHQDKLPTHGSLCKT